MWMASCDAATGKWSGGELQPYGPLPVYPSAQALNYGQAVFEGMKAQRSAKVRGRGRRRGRAARAAGLAWQSAGRVPFLNGRPPTLPPCTPLLHRPSCRAASCCSAPTPTRSACTRARSGWPWCRRRRSSSWRPSRRWAAVHVMWCCAVPWWAAAGAGASWWWAGGLGRGAVWLHQHLPREFRRPRTRPAPHPLPAARQPSPLRCACHASLPAQTVEANADWVPPQGKGSLYLRPLLVGSGPILGLGPAPAYTLVSCRVAFRVAAVGGARQVAGGGKQQR